MNGASSELQGILNDYISFAMYYEMCSVSQIKYFFVPKIDEIWDTIYLNSVNKSMRFIIKI